MDLYGAPAYQTIRSPSLSDHSLAPPAWPSPPPPRARRPPAVAQGVTLLRNGFVDAAVDALRSEAAPGHEAVAQQRDALGPSRRPPGARWRRRGPRRGGYRVV